MATPQGDGSIILETSVDTSGIEKGTRSMKNTLNNVTNSTKKLGMTLQNTLLSANPRLETLKNNFRKATAEVEKQTAKVEELKNRLNQLQSGEITIKDKGVKNLEKDFDKTNQSIEQTKIQLDELDKKIEEVRKNSIIIEGKEWFSPETEKELNDLVERSISLQEKLELDTQKASDLEISLQEAIGAATQAEIDNVNSQLTITNEKLAEATSKAENAGKKLKDGMSQNIPVISDINEGMENFSKRIIGLAKRVFIFSLFTKALRGIVSTTKDVLMSNESFRRSLENLKSALWTAFSPVLNYIVPALRNLVNWLTLTIISVTKLAAMLTGKSYESMVKNGQKLKEQVDSYKELNSNIKNATKEVKKQIAAFDDLNILQSENIELNNEENKSGENAGIGTGENEIDKTQFISKLEEIGMIAGWAMVGLGIILMFSGHPLTGIAMAATGFAVAVGAATEGSITLGENEKQKLIEIGTITGVALIGLGVLVLFTKFWKYGLGMITSGATAVYSALTLGGFSQDVKTFVSEILLISGIVAFTLGVILLFIKKAGVWKYGLGLMALGASEVVGALFLGGDELKAELQSFVLKYWKEIYALGALMVIVGIVLLFCKQWKYGFTLLIEGIAVVAAATYLGGDELKAELQSFVLRYWKEIYALGALMVVVGICLIFSKLWGIGFTLIIAGIATVATATALSGDTLKTEIQSFITKYWEEIYAISAVVVIVGILLLFSPLWGIGLALIATGIGVLVEATKFGGEELKQEIYNTAVAFKTEIMLISSIVFVIGMVLLFVPGCLFVGLSLLGVGALALFGGTKLDSRELNNELTSELNKVNAKAKSGVNKINKTLSEINTPTGGDYNLNTNSLPKYARGTVVPANMPHAAIVGDNTEEPEVISPISTMKTAFIEALTEMRNNFGGGDTTVILEVDGREFGRAVVEQGDREKRRVGTSLVVE